MPPCACAFHRPRRRYVPEFLVGYILSFCGAWRCVRESPPARGLSSECPNRWPEHHPRRGYVSVLASMEWQGQTLVVRGARGVPEGRSSGRGERARGKCEVCFSSAVQFSLIAHFPRPPADSLLLQCYDRLRKAARLAEQAKRRAAAAVRSAQAEVPRTVPGMFLRRAAALG